MEERREAGKQHAPMGDKLTNNDTPHKSLSMPMAPPMTAISSSSHSQPATPLRSRTVHLPPPLGRAPCVSVMMEKHGIAERGGLEEGGGPRLPKGAAEHY